MINRFADASENLVEVFLTTMEARFPSLVNLKIKLVFDTKRRIKKGKVCLASTELANEKTKYFTKDTVAQEGYDYIMIFDMKAWENASDEYKTRLMSHELRHIFIDENGKCKLLPHDVSDFRAEQQLNTEDPDWSFKLSTLVNDLYEQEKEMAKTSKGEM